MKLDKRIWRRDLGGQTGETPKKNTSVAHPLIFVCFLFPSLGFRSTEDPYTCRVLELFGKDY